MEVQLEHVRTTTRCMHVFARLAPICSMLSRCCLVTKFLRRSSVAYYECVVGWEGERSNSSGDGGARIQLCKFCQGERNEKKRFWLSSSHFLGAPFKPQKVFLSRVQQVFATIQKKKKITLQPSKKKKSSTAVKTGVTINVYFKKKNPTNIGIARGTLSGSTFGLL